MNIKLITCLFVFLNILFIFLIYYLGISRVLFNLDYLLLILFSYKNNFLFRLFLFLFLFLFFDVFLIFIQYFPFLGVGDFLYLSGFVFNGPLLYRYILISIIIYFFICFFVVRDYFFKYINFNIKEFLFLIVIYSSIFFINNIFFEKKLVGSSFQEFYYTINEDLNNDSKENILISSRFDNATKPLFLKIHKENELSNKILLVVNESWGETLNPNHQLQILLPIFKKKNYLIFLEQGSFNFVGATVSGELRELCHKQPRILNLKDIQKKELENCLPNQFKKLGYSTFSFHGAMGDLYDRYNWYPKIGFNHNYFFNDLMGGGECKAFMGRCDTKLIFEIKNKLLLRDKSFVYWLTLNTHSPYDDIMFNNDFNCGVLGINENSETCRIYKLQYQFFNTLSELIDDPNMKGVEVIVVGDHSPPIINMNENFLSFKGSQVAWLHFKIK